MFEDCVDKDKSCKTCKSGERKCAVGKKPDMSGKN